MQQNQILPGFTPEEAEEWRIAVADAEADGTFFIAELFNCAVGTKPGWRIARNWAFSGERCPLRGPR